MPGRVEVVELTMVNGPEERGQRDTRHCDGQWQNDKQHAHRPTAFRPPANPPIERTDKPSTVAELTGIMIAAIIGVIQPPAASAAARTLYPREITRFRWITRIVFRLTCASSTIGCNPGCAI